MSNQCEATQPVTIIMTELLRQFFGDSLAVPQVFPLIGLGGSQSHCHFSQLHYLVAQSNFHRLCFSYLPLKGAYAIYAWQHLVAETRWCLPSVFGVIPDFNGKAFLLLLMLLSYCWLNSGVCVMAPDCGLYGMLLESLKPAILLPIRPIAFVILHFKFSGIFMLTSGADHLFRQANEQLAV